jgi:hypothetical protein
VAWSYRSHDFCHHETYTAIRCLVSLFCSLVFIKYSFVGNKRSGTEEEVMGTIAEAIAQYDDEHAFARQLTIPEEDRAKFMSVGWEGGYRWFRSPNVICLEKYRHLRTLGRI